MKKRLTSLFLAVVLALSMAAPALADGGGWTELDAAGVQALINGGSPFVLVYYNNTTSISDIKDFADGAGIPVYAYSASSEETDCVAGMFTSAPPCPALLICKGPGQIGARAPLSAGAVMSALQEIGLYNPAVNSTKTMTAADQAVYNTLIALQSNPRFREGQPWTDKTNEYFWSGSISKGAGVYGHGCAAFAMELSDIAFGENIPAVEITNFSYSDIHTGTMLRVNNDSHSVIVLETYDDHITVAEGNYGGTVHWGRVMTKSDVMSTTDFITVRRGAPVAVTPAPTPEKPAETEKPADKTDTDKPADKADEQKPAETEKPADTKPEDTKPEDTKKPEDEKKPDETKKPEDEKKPDETTKTEITFTDVAENSYYAPAVSWAVEKEVTTGTGDGTTFSPAKTCSRSEVVTFLWRALGKPEAKTDATFTDLTQDWYKDAVVWAVATGVTNGAGDGLFAPDRTCSGAEIITFIYRALNSLEASQGGDQFYSVAEKWVNDNNLSADMGFELTKDCSRAMTVTFLFRGLADPVG